MKTIDKVLIKLKVLQIRDNQNKLFSIYEPKEHRLNPYNPLSYIFWVIGELVYFFYNIYLVIKSNKIKNPFKWD